MKIIIIRTTNSIITQHFTQARQQNPQFTNILRNLDNKLYNSATFYTISKTNFTIPQHFTQSQQRILKFRNILHNFDYRFSTIPQYFTQSRQ